MNNELFQIVSQYLNQNRLEFTSFNLNQVNKTKSISSKQCEDAIIEGRLDEIIAYLKEKYNLFHENSRNLIDEMLFELIEIKIMEQKTVGNQFEALRILRSELTPLGMFPNRIHKLTQDILSKNVRVYERSKSAIWISANLKTVPGLFFADHRLEELVEQAREYQKMKCSFHREEVINKSLWVDHANCRKLVVSDIEKTELLALMDDSRFSSLSLSRDGTKLQVTRCLDNSNSSTYQSFVVDLASGDFEEVSSKFDDCSIWPKVDELITREEFSKLLTGIKSREETNNVQDEQLLSVACMADGDFYINSTAGQITTLFDAKEGKVLFSWIRLRCSHLLTPRDVNDRYFLAVSDDGSVLQISTESFKTMKTIPSVDEKHAVSSAFLDGKRLLIGFSNSTLYYYDDWESYSHPTRIFRGHTCTNHPLSAILSRSNPNLALSCSENGSIYGWNIETGRQIYEIKVHEKMVTDILEIGVNEFVTGGNDGKIYRWKL